MALTPPKTFFTALNFVERAAAYAQGKGYGTATIKRELSLATRFLRRPIQLAIDIGGNVGDYTAALRNQNPAARIHTFEPSRANLTKLQARFGNDSAITLVPFAVSDQAGAATLFSNAPGSGLGSLTKRRLDHFDIDFKTQEEIRTVVFEDYWRNALAASSLDLVKIDVEGHELSVLKGFNAALSVTSVIQFEFGGCNIDTRTYFQDFWYFFKNQPFDLYRITPFGAEKLLRYAESDEVFSTTNYLAVNRSQA